MSLHKTTLPALRVAAIGHIGPYSQISEAFALFERMVAGSGLRERPDVQMIALYYDDPVRTPAEELRSAAGLTVPNGIALPTNISEIRFEPAVYALATHVGPYSGLPTAWTQLMRDAFLGARVAIGPGLEIYKNNPSDTPPEKLVTELYWPLG